jgi:hypothetical protein
METLHVKTLRKCQSATSIETGWKCVIAHGPSGAEDQGLQYTIARIERARENRQPPPAQDEYGWMVGGQETLLSLGSVP